MSPTPRPVDRQLPPAAVRTPSARTQLRAATAAAHEAIDGLFSTLGLDDRTDYARFLTAQAAAFAPVERALDAAGAGAIIPDWPARRRLALIVADLAELGLPLPAPAADFAVAGPAAVLGAAYVLEGSRLGGTLLKRQVPAAFPTRFLGAADSSLWRTLLALLDARLTTAASLADATEAAVRVFGVFAASGRRYVGGDAGVG